VPGSSDLPASLLTYKGSLITLGHPDNTGLSPRLQISLLASLSLSSACNLKQSRGLVIRT
jgi:hypothetical protein